MRLNMNAQEKTTITLHSQILEKERQIMSTNSLARFCQENKENFDPLADLKLAQMRRKIKSRQVSYQYIAIN